jgi:CubicO group peptidase (beta-lactamase class C family)
MERRSHLAVQTALERMSAYRVPGLALSIVDDGAMVQEGAYGVCESGGTDPVTSRTLFQACSISKPIVALAMLRLVERGDLDLDADVNDLLTSWRLPANGDWQPQVTLRQLVSHTAGLTTSGFPGYRRDEPQPSLYDVLVGRAPANTFGVRVDTVPGTQFRYSGGGTTAVQQLLQDVTRTPLPELLSELVLEPLGMHDSTYEQPLPPSLHERAASAHLRDGTVVPGRWHVYPEQAAAGLWTTPADLCRYAIGVQAAVAGAPGALISPELARQMLTPVAATGRWDLESIGLGPFLGGSGQTLRFGHGGGNEGFKCQLVGYAHTGQAAAVMTNSDNGRVLCFEILAAIASAMRWPDYPALGEDWDLPSPADLAREAGRYALRPGVELSVIPDGYDLRVTISGQRPLRFFHDAARSFFCNVLETRLSFDGAPSAQAETAVFHQNGESITCQRVG